MAGRKREGALTKDEKRIVKALLNAKWRNQDIQALVIRDDVEHKGVIVFPGSGITENLADKARRLGIPVRRFGAAAPH